VERAKLHAWLTSQIEERRPPPALEAGMGQPIQELARALAALEHGGGTVFGMIVHGDDLASFAVAARAALVEWRARMEAEHGEEGRTLVTSLAARCDVVLEDDELAAQPASDAVEQLVDALVPTQLEAVWRAGGQLDDDRSLRVQVGEPDRERLAHLVKIARASFGELPASYVALLEIYNGIAVYPFDPPASLVRVEGGKLSEPEIWPAETYGDHFQLEDTPLAGIDRPFMFGELADVGYLVLDVTGGAVYWVPRQFSVSDPTRLADSFDAFLVTFAEHAASLPLLLRRAGVPGWGA
jgi:hypothetical protein